MQTLTDPHARSSVVAVRRAGAPLWLVVALATSLGASVVGLGLWGIQRGKPVAASLGVEVKPTHDVLVAIQDIAKLEVTEVQVEKVVDLSDKQKILGWVETEDQMLLVAAGPAVVGIDLEKLGPEDARYDEETRTVTLRLRPPQVLNARLDHDNTYVYKRETGWLAKRNEQLESRARKEAVAAVERAANAPDVMARAKKQAERQLTMLLTHAGAKKVVVIWDEGLAAKAETARR
jgi:hypothetical protein